MADVQILRSEAASNHLDFVVPGSQEIIVKALKASYDGGGAGGSFVPAVQVLSPAGEDAGTYTASVQLAAGDSADVSFGPFLLGLDNAIRFDVDNQGGSLDITTNDGAGIEIEAKNNGNVEVTADGSLFLTAGGVTIGNQFGAGTGLLTVENFHLGLNFSGGFMEVQTEGFEVDSSSGIFLTAQGGDVDISPSGGGDLHVTTVGGGTQVYSSADGYIFDSTHTATGLVAFAVRVRTGDIFAVEDGSSSDFQLVQFGPGVTVFSLQANKSFTVKDHSGNTILRVDENGPAYHIKTGKVWVADL